MGPETGSEGLVRRDPADEIAAEAPGSVDARSRMRTVRAIDPPRRPRHDPASDRLAHEQGVPGLGIPDGVQFHVLSFEGPDGYARIGGLESRVGGIWHALVSAGHETHLWFVGDPGLSGHEDREGLHLHRWCQWL